MVALSPHHLPPSPPGRHCSLRPHTRARCPPVSSSMSSCVLFNVLLCPPQYPPVSLYVLLLCLHMLPSCAIHYILLCIPRCSSVSSLMSSCVTMCSCVFSCLLPVPSYVCSPPVSSYILLVSPAVFPLNVLLCLLAIILPSLVPSFKSLFCVHVFMKLFKSSTLYADLFILCPHLTRIIYSTIK